MKKRSLLLVLLAVCLAFAGCAAKDNEPAAESPVVQKDPMTVATPEPADGETEEEAWGDPLAEEDQGGFIPGTVYDAYGNAVYAGATPIPLDPIDMPTATPRPSLAFTYTPIAAESLGVRFEAPQGWMMDASKPGTLVLMDPQAYDNVNATLTISVTPVAPTYKLADAKKEVTTYLAELGKGYTTWKTFEIASRTLLDKDGYYNNYRGEQADGTVVRGRVMVALLDGNQIMTVHMAAPGWYNESYMNVVAHFRDTLKKQ